MGRRLYLDPDSIFKMELGAFLRICKEVNTPRSLACYMLATSEEWEQYLALPFPDTAAESFADDHLVTEMMRKNPLLPGLAIDRKGVALAKFFEAELECETTNVRLRGYSTGTIVVPSELSSAVAKTQSLIAGILGPLSRAKLAFAESKFQFGPGATSSVSGRDVLLSKKMTCNMQVTPSLYPYWRSLLTPRWGREVHSLELRAFSKVTTVPKTALTDRVIAIEPHLNIYVQLGIGKLIRRQLLLAGLDLEHQQKMQQAAASVAHNQGLATIDLSSASDSISRELVWLLLPSDWATLLDIARTEYAEVEGQEVRLSKFSSMGNGYTFELESLIFWAIAQACSPLYAQAYGDDIVVKQESALYLIRTLNFLGFSVNSKKSFLAGDFFESCGEDYWRGRNVRPIYFKGDYQDHVSAIIHMANAIRRYAFLRGNHYFCDRRFLPAWLFLVSKSFLARQTHIPNGVGDEGLVKNFDECTPPRLRHGLQGYIGKVYRIRPRRAKNTDKHGALVAALAWGSKYASRNTETWRGEIDRSQLTSIPCFTWDGLGPWY